MNKKSKIIVLQLAIRMIKQIDKNDETIEYDRS